MAAEQKQQKTEVEPRGFGQRTRGLSGEYAHEQGWGLNEEERTARAKGPQNTDGGTDYEYGARDFGDEPVNTATVAGGNAPEGTTAGTDEKATQEAGSSGAKGGA
jgi:hypothetical protein